MKTIIQFLLSNKWILLSGLAGIIAGYFYWLYYGCYWGTYPFSSEWWVNCSYGGLTCAGVASVLTNKN